MKLVFDLGGVVFRWQPEDFLVRLLPARAPDAFAGQALATAFFQGFGGEWREFDLGVVEPEPLAARIAARLGLEPVEALGVIEAIPDELQPMPATVALLERLKAEGHRLFFLSNMPVPYASHLQARDAAVFALFESGLFSSRVGLLKPDAAMFAHAASHFGAAPPELVLIDDLARNVDAARAAGWRGVLFEDAARCEVELHGLAAG